MFAINKPAGLMVHGDGRTKEKTLADLILKEYPKLKNIGEPMEITDQKTKKKVVIYRPGIVHRLDKETSGVLLIAKNQKTFEYLKKLFQDRGIKKTYRAVVHKNIKAEGGVVDQPIGRSKTDFRQWHSGRGIRGETREAVTEYKVLSRFKKNKEDFCYVEVNPKTGRTHQIRVHMKFLQHPVAGDALYSPKNKQGLWSRMMLHALSIEFKNPKGKVIKIEAPLPKEFKDLGEVA